jgi:cation-transporting ATPase 13A1
MNLPVRVGEETTVPADILLVNGTCIVNEAMLSGESTPLLKESIQLLETTDSLDTDGQHRNAVLFSGTKVLQASKSCMLFLSPLGLPFKFASHVVAEIPSPIVTPNQGCLGIVLRTGFGTAQGQLVRTMIFSTERVSANNLESFLFLGFLLIFAIAASWYVWTKGWSFLFSFLFSLTHPTQGLKGISKNRNYCSTASWSLRASFRLSCQWNYPLQ